MKKIKSSNCDQKVTMGLVLIKLMLWSYKRISAVFEDNHAIRISNLLDTLCFFNKILEKVKSLLKTTF